MKIDTIFIDGRINQLRAAYEAAQEKALHIAGALQEALYLKSLLEKPEVTPKPTEATANSKAKPVRAKGNP